MNKVVPTSRKSWEDKPSLSAWWYLAISRKTLGTHRSKRNSLVGGLVDIFYFPIYWVSNPPNWLSYFSEGFKPPTRNSTLAPSMEVSEKMEGSPSHHSIYRKRGFPWLASHPASYWSTPMETNDDPRWRLYDQLVCYWNPHFRSISSQILVSTFQFTYFSP